MWILKRNQSVHVLAVAVAMQVTQVLTSIKNHLQNSALQINILRKNLLYLIVVPKVVCLDLDQCLQALKNVLVKNEILQVKTQALSVNVNPPNINVLLEDEGAVIVAVAAVYRHHVIKRKVAIVQVVHALLVALRAVNTLEVLVLAITLAVLCLLVVQSLDLHLYLGDGGRLVFWIEDELQGKFSC